MVHIPIQIVDKNDNPIGEAETVEAQEKGLIHRIVRVMVEDGKGNILLQKRSPGMLRWPNCWDNSAAGHVDVGEDYLTAAKRELEEELGIPNAPLKEIGSYYTDRPLGKLRLRRFNKVYKLAVSKTPKNFSREEVAEVKWLSVDAVKKLVAEQPDQVTDGLDDVVNRYY